MIIRVYTFSKRHNSTAIPSGGTDLNVRLKDNCTILNPMIEFTGEYTGWNYAYIPKFNRYYFASSPGYSTGNIYTMELAVDVLASWKTNIGSTRAFIEHCSNGTITIKDSRIAVSGAFERNVSLSPFAGALANQSTAPSGTFCLTALAKDGRYPSGIMTTYFMTYSQMRQLANVLVDPAAFEEIAQYFTNPFDAIAECSYIPLDVSSYLVTADLQHVKIATYDTGILAKIASATNFALQSQHTTIEIPYRTDSEGNPWSGYLKLEPFTSMELFCPFCGSKAISPESVYGLEQILIDYSVDFISGNVQAFAYNKREILAEFSGNCRTLIPVGQSQPLPYRAFAAEASTFVSGAGANAIVQQAGIKSPFGLLFAPSSHKIAGGFSGSPLGAILGNETMRWQQFVLAVTQHNPSDYAYNYEDIIGQSSYRVRSISGAGGYVQTSGASVAAPATDAELDQINSMLDNGIYYE